MMAAELQHPGALLRWCSENGKVEKVIAVHDFLNFLEASAAERGGKQSERGGPLWGTHFSEVHARAADHSNREIRPTRPLLLIIISEEHAFALFFIAEYVNMITVSALTVIFFFGGWLSPLEGYPGLAADSWLVQPGFFWFGVKILFPMFSFLWLRATFPRYRYDQIMRLGWKALIPVTLIWLLVEGVMAYYHVGPWKT